MQVIATGKWSKADKGWLMVVALRRSTTASGSPPASPNRKGARQNPRQNPPR
jgi:hypothetical protein